MTQGNAPAPRSRRIRARLYAVIFPVGVGLFCSWAIFQSFVNYSGWLLEPWVVVAVVVGCVLWPVVVSLTGVTERLARPNAEFWHVDLRSTRRTIAASLYGCASIAWGMALVVLFGTKPVGQ